MRTIETMTRREWCGAALGAVTGLALGPTARAASADDLDDLDGMGLAAMVRRRKVSPRELLDRAIALVEHLQPSINAIAVKDYDFARSELQRLDPSAPFAGVPFLLKDLWVALAGTVSTNGSKFYDGVRADYDGELVRRFRAAGLVILGKAASPELGLSPSTESALHGAVRNPWNTARTAGGSSGGSAAAVAAGIVPLAHASDGGGSIRIPAACCGLFGLKPSRGRVPFPVRRFEGWAGLSTHFAVTRSVRDAAALLDAVAGPDVGAPFLAAPGPGEFLAATRTRARKLRIARLPQPLSGTAVDPACARAVEEAAALCTRLGHQVRDAAPPLDFKTYNAAFGTVLAVQALASLRDREAQLGRACTPDDVEPVTWMIAQSARQIDGVMYARAREVFDQTARRMGEFLRDYDLILSPTLAKPPIELGRLALSSTDFQQFAQEASTFSPYTALANITGQPAMSVPLAMSGEGLPIGVMLQGRFGEESTLLSLAASLEREQPWAGRRPSNLLPPQARRMVRSRS